MSGAAEGILVVGGGIAGQAVCEEVRRRDADMPLTLVCGEAVAPYDRVRLSHLLAGEADAEELALRPDDWYADRRVDLLLGRQVVALDADAGIARLDDGLELRFAQAALCTGSDPLMPPLPGIDLPGVYAFRTPQDCAAIAAGAAGARRAFVIGGGLLGLEAAYGLVQHGVHVTVVHLVDRLMERQLDAAAAALLLPAIEALGVRVLLERETAELRAEADGRVTAVRFADGSEQQADLVVVSIGIRPRVELARAAGARGRARNRRRRPHAQLTSAAWWRSASAPSTAASCTGSSRRSTSRRRSRRRRSWARGRPRTPARFRPRS